MPTPTLLFVVGLVAFCIAFVAGKWRQTCIFWMVENRINVPLGWHRSEFRFGTLAVVVVFSLLFATTWAYLLAESVGTLIGAFSWGALLLGRWYASQIAAHI